MGICFAFGFRRQRMGSLTKNPMPVLYGVRSSEEERRSVKPEVGIS